MTRGEAPPAEGQRYTSATALTVFLVSVALIALQLFYMRALSVSRNYHFSYLVISTALLGFGAGGTFLTFTFDKLARRFELWSHRFLLFFSLSIPLSYAVSRMLPIDIRYIFYSFSQFALLLLYNLLLILPFFFGAVFIGFSLSYFKKHIPVLYGVNLFGSGLGGIGALLIIHLLPPEILPLSTVVFALLAQLLWLCLSKKKDGSREKGAKPSEGISSLLLAAGVAAAVLLLPMDMKIGEYKALSHLQRLERQGDAERLFTGYSPRARMDIYEASSLHHTLFASPEAGVVPPPQLSVLYDGEPAGTIFRIRESGGARIMDSTPQSLPYRLLRSRIEEGEGPEPRSLLLGEVGGPNIWLSRRFGVEQCTVVQPNSMLIQSLEGTLEEESGGVFTLPGVEIAHRPTRLFVERSNARYDLIHIVSAEGMPSGAGGLQSLHEDFLLTQEGIAACIELLEERGMITITRGIQSPPRDNMKIFALFLEVLRDAGADNPEDHILQSRNYLAVNTIIGREPFDEVDVAAFRRESKNLGMDVEYHPGIESENIEQRNKIEGPPGKSYSYYHEAAIQLTSGRADSFLKSWVYKLEPPTDNRPYFYNFFKWSSMGDFLETYQGKFLQRMELSYLVLVLTLAEISIIAFVLILLPLLIGRSRGIRRASRSFRLPVLLHFGAIGFGFMFLEMVMIQKFGLFLGDPIYSASAVITAILLCSGIGSSLQSRIPLAPQLRIKISSLAVVTLIALVLLFLDLLLDLGFGLPLFIRYVIALVVLTVPSFFMGWMLPSGMGMLGDEASELIPWAWGINGFSSVAAGPLAMLISMEAGFPATLTAAAVCYAAAGITTYLWPTVPHRGAERD